MSRAEAGLQLAGGDSLAGAKTTTQVEANAPGRCDCGVLSAYEIHMGVTEAQPAFEYQPERPTPSG